MAAPAMATSIVCGDSSESSSSVTAYEYIGSTCKESDPAPAGTATIQANTFGGALLRGLADRIVPEPDPAEAPRVRHRELAAVVEPAIIVIMGLVVAFIVFTSAAMILPGRTW